MKATTKTGTKNRKTGLGKGLDLLIPDIDAEELTAKRGNENENSTGGPVLLKINDIEPNRNQPRKNFDEEALDELAESIKRYGVRIKQAVWSDTAARCSEKRGLL